MQNENPYQSPAEDGFVETVLKAEPSPAPAWRRLVNLLLDYLALLLLSFGIGVVIVVVARAFHVRNVIHKIPNILLGLAVFLLYYVPQETLWGKTLAKLVTGTRVVSATGARPTFAQIVRRTFCRLLPFEPFSFLFGGDNPVGWHDQLSNTRVVMDR